MRGLVMLGLSALLLGSAAWANEAKSYNIALRFDPGSGAVQATARVALKPEPQAKTLTFYLHDELKVSSLRLNGRKLAFHQGPVAYDFSYDTKANRVEAKVAGLSAKDELEVVYSGRFSPSTARSPSDYMRGDKDGLYLRSYGYSLWFPIFAPDRSSFSAVDFESVRITAPERLRAVFVGVETARAVKSGEATATWQAKAVGPFDAQLTLRPFQLQDGGEVKTYALGDVASLAAADRVITQAGKLVAYYRNHYRRAAGERVIHLVEEPPYGDIAGANMIGLAEERWRGIKDDGDEIETLAHELVHAFVQTPTAKTDALYAFQIEGFPSYFHLPALGSLLGEGWYKAQLDHVEKAYLERRATGKYRGETMPPEKAILALTADDISAYKDVFVLNDRALLFWDYLRRKAPPSAYDGFVHALTAAPNVSADSFFALLGQYMPELVPDAHSWLETTAFPDAFRRQQS